jgi:multimeric flavodoxin WrbA
MGCYGCWIKTPGHCIINEHYQNIGELFSKSDRLIIISRCLYGSYSPFVRNVLDRSISYLLPYFVTINGQTRHQCRYNNKLTFSVYFYGEVSDEEKETARKLVNSNGIGYHVQKSEVFFYSQSEEIKGVYNENCND